MDPSAQAQITLAQWAIQQGGAFVIVLTVLFFYRRDYKILTDTLVQLVIKNTEAQTAHTAALAENTRVVHSAKEFMRRYTAEPGFWEAEERRADANARREEDKRRRGNGEAQA